MKIYSYDFFRNYLEIEVEKAKRYGYCFTVVYFENGDPDQHDIARVHIGTGFRIADVITEIEEGKYLALLYATREKAAERAISRIEKLKPVLKKLHTTHTEVRDDDNVHSLMYRLNKAFVV